MALINRMSRLLTADVHAVLDRIEEPESLLRHAVREMEEELERTADHARSLEQERERLADRARKIDAVLTELAPQVGVALDAGHEDLARKLIKRKLETAKLGAHVGERAAALAKTLTEHRALLDEQRERLDVMRQKAELLATAPRGETEEALRRTDFTVGDDEVEVALLRERQQRTRS